MAYPTRGRDPLFDSTTQAALERRGKELLGLALVAVGMAMAGLLWSYTPADPSWMAASDAPVQNWLGRGGAIVAAATVMIIGAGGWAVAVLLFAWGVRLALHRGQERALGRLIFAPIAVALVSLYAATLTPGPNWEQTFGLGGLFGDTAASVMLTLVPLKAAFGVKMLSIVTGLAVAALGAFVLGFTWAEIRNGLRFLALGLVVLYAQTLRLMGRGAGASMRATRGMASAIAEKRAEVRRDRAEAAAEEAARRAVPHPTDAARVAAVIRARRAAATAEPEDADLLIEADHPGYAAAHMPAGAEGRGGLLSFLRRGHDPMPEPELVEAGTATGPVPPADQDRVRAKISDAIMARLGRPPAGETGPRSAIAAAVAGRRKGPDPMILPGQGGLRAEPPLTAAPADESAMMARVTQAALRAMPPAPAPRTDLDDDAAQSHETAAPAARPGLPPQIPVPTNRPIHARPDGPLHRKVVHAPQPRPVPSRQAVAEAQPALQFDDPQAPVYETPPLSLLASPDRVERHHLSDEALEENARMLETVLDDYGVKGEIVSVRPGPVVTMYELEPAPGLKASRVIGLADDIARSMSALSARVSTVPGRSVIGIELPNEKREMVVLREMLSHRDFGDGNQRLPLALGKDIGGDPVIANLAKMPHLLIAGTTGSGKSVAINTMILSLLYKLTPEECRLIMIDPKMLELSVYDGIPHLLSPVVTDPKKAVVALKWTVGEMEDRYRKMSKMGVRNIEGYNGRVRDALAKGEMFSRTVQTGFDDETGDPVFETEQFAPELLPYIVVIVDEMADLMMVAGKEIEACIQRLAQMARASGIHIIMATQRPSVDVITGTIKANFPTRISFQVTSKVDSRTILGEQGAEQLLGQGDMLYMAGGAKITRVHGPFVSDEEVEEIVTFLKGFGPPDYQSGVVEGPEDEKADTIDAVLGLGGNTDGDDALYDQAVAIVAKDRKCSTSYIQRKLAIGYNKAARLVEQMEDEGVVSPANHVGKREVLIPEA